MASSSIPPASPIFLSSLPTIIITIDDISSSLSSDPSISTSLSPHLSPECLICLDSLEIGTVCCKLDCGHIFHENCLESWLIKQGTCPECRYEYVTDSSLSYERERKKRMKERRLRLRRDELNRKTVKQLKDIFEIYELNSKNCFEKSELVEKLISSGYIDLQKRAPNIEMNWNDLKSKSINELKKMMKAFGISTTNLIEKDELLDALRLSGRITLSVSVPETNPLTGEEEENDLPPPLSTENTSLYSFSSSTLLGDDTNTHTCNNYSDPPSVSFSQQRTQTQTPSSSPSSSSSQSRRASTTGTAESEGRARGERRRRGSDCLIQ